MRIYFAGGEISTHRSLLSDMDVRSIALSYMGLRRRVKFARPWLIREKFDPHISVFLDSGAYTINAEDSKITQDELEAIYDHYKQFVLANIDAVDMVSEFDALPLGQEWIETERTRFWDTLPREKVMVVWHPELGTGKLLEMAEDYEIIGIPSVSMDGRNLAPVLNALAAKGTRLHGIAMTKMEVMQSIKWSSVASTSWISPQRFGDTIIWTGNQLKRYPKRDKDRARRQHRTLIAKEGFDPEKIANDEGDEVLRLSIWSWLQFEDYVNKHHREGRVVTNLFSDAEAPKTANLDDEVVTPPSEGGNDVSTEAVDPTPDSKEVEAVRETTALPVMGFERHKTTGDQGEEEEIPVLKIRSESARVCDSCYLANNCPAYEPGSNCAYNIPITIRTREQMKALWQGLVEMQAQRVMFMKFAEDREGGYADPNLTKELKVLTNMMSSLAEQEREGFSLSLNVRGPASQGADSGMISNLFGRDVGQKVQQIESGPQSADQIIDAVVVDAEEDK